MNNVNKLDSSAKRSMKTRIITAVVLIAIAAGSLILGGYYWFAFISIGMIFGIYEFIHATGRKYKWYVYLICYLATLIFCVWIFFKEKVINLISDNPNFSFFLERDYANLSIPIVVVVLLLGSLFLISILHDEFTLHDVAYLFMMCLLIGLGCQALLYIRYFPLHAAFSNNGFLEADLSRGSFLYFHSALLMAYVVLCTCLNDAMAYFVGVFFGKHKINPRVSPKKTYEGFVGGWLLASGISFIIFLLFTFVGYPLLPGTLDLEHWYIVLLISFIIPGLGNLGDFSFSLIKRTFNVKDYGWIIVGHGGILDRADSILFSTIGCALILNFIEYYWVLFA